MAIASDSDGQAANGQRASLRTADNGKLSQAPPPQVDTASSNADALYETEVNEYCNHVVSAATTEAALLKYPWVFADFGIIPVHSLELTTAVDNTRSTYVRFRSGLGFSPTRYYRGQLTAERARRECERYRAERNLQRRLSHLADVNGQGACWAAKLSVIEDALPRANELLERVKSDAANGRATIVDVDAVETRLNQLREQAAEARMRLAESGPALPSAPIDANKLVQDRIASEAAVEQVESKLRRSTAFDITVTGGYDRFFGAYQRFPAFAMVGVTFNPAWFVTGDLAAKSSTARARYVAASAEQNLNLERERRERLRGVISAEQAWLRQTTAIRAELESRVARFSAIEGEKSRAYTDQLWFEIVRLRAEEAYLSSHLRDLAKALGINAEPDSAR